MKERKKDSSVICTAGITSAPPITQRGAVPAISQLGGEDLNPVVDV